MRQERGTAGTVGPARARRPILATRKTSYSIRSLALGLQILEALVKDGRERGISELARQLGTTKWRIFRQMHTLCEHGFLRQNGKAEKFDIGPRTYALLEALPNRFDFVREGRPELVRLRDERGHTTVMAALVDDRAVTVVAAEPGRRAVQFNLKLGATFDLHASAHGKVALAFGPPHLLESVIARGLTAHTDHTITDPARLRREVQKIRLCGWAVAPEEAFRGVNTLVAPILSGENKYLGSIGVFGSIDHIPRTPDPKDVQAVRKAAARISEKLRWKQ